MKVFCEDEIQYLINECEKYLSPNLQVRRRALAVYCFVFLVLAAHDSHHITLKLPNKCKLGGGAGNIMEYMHLATACSEDPLLCDILNEAILCQSNKGPSVASSNKALSVLSEDIVRHKSAALQ